MLGAPLALGFLADRVGVARAFALVIVLVALALLLLGSKVLPPHATRARRRTI